MFVSTQNAQTFIRINVMLARKPELPFIPINFQTLLHLISSNLIIQLHKELFPNDFTEVKTILYLKRKNANQISNIFTFYICWKKSVSHLFIISCQNETLLFIISCQNAVHIVPNYDGKAIVILTFYRWFVLIFHWSKRWRNLPWRRELALI